MLLLLGAGAAPLPPESLTLPDLANHPERLPPTVTINDNIKFGRTTLKKGQHLQVVSFDGKTIKVTPDSKTNYPIEPADCDLLDAANAVWKTLTPAQRAVDAAMLVTDASLWPATVKVLPAVKVGDRKFPANSEFVLAGYTKDGAHVYSPANDGHLINIELADTDLLARARELAKLDISQRPSRIAAELKGRVVDANGKPLTPDLDGTKIFVLYYGADWCSWCHKVTPSLVKVMNEVGPRNPHLTFVMVNCDDKPEDMLRYMKEAHMPWGAISKSDSKRTGVLPAMQANTPHLKIVDHFGNNIYDQPGGGPEQIDADVKALLELDQAGTAH